MPAFTATTRMLTTRSESRSVIFLTFPPPFAFMTSSICHSTAHKWDRQNAITLANANKQGARRESL